MKKIKWVVVLLIITSLALAVPAKVNFQGKLSEGGVAVTGTKAMTFTIKTEGGTTLWTDAAQTNVSVVNGIYNVTLEPPASIFDRGDQLKLSVSVGGVPLSPDIMLLSSPYAYISKIAETVTANAAAGNSVIAAANKGSGVMNVANGGTGQSTFSSGIIKSNGTALSSGQVDMASNVTGTLPVGNGGTGASTLTTGVIKSNGTVLSSGATLDDIAEGTIYKRLQTASANTLTGGGDANSMHTHSGLVASSLNAGTVPVVRGGTGATTLTGVLKGNGTGAFTGSATMDDIADGTNYKRLSAAYNTNLATLTGGTSTTLHQHPTASITTGVFSMARGGTGATSITSGVVRSDGATLASGAVALGGSEVSGTLLKGNGGTGSTDGSITGAGALAYTSASNTNLTIAAPGAGLILLSSNNVSMNAAAGTMTFNY